MRELKQSSAANVMIFMTSSTDHIAGATGLSLTITLSKDGGVFASISPTVTERGNGWYALSLTAAHTDTLGDLAFHIAATGADPADPLSRVVAQVEADTYGRLGAPAGASLAADVAAVQGDTDNLQTRLPAALVGGRMDSQTGAMAADVLTAAALAASAVAEIQTGLSTLDAAGVWAHAARTLSSGANIVLAKGTGVTGFNDLDAAGVRAAVGLGSANLDTQLAGIQGDTDNIQTRLPAALVGGRMDSSTGAMAANTLTASALAADAVAEIQTGLSTHTAADVWAVATRTTTGGTVTAITGVTLPNVESMATRFLTMIEVDGPVYRYTVNALELAPAGGGGGADPALIADAVWDEALSGHAAAGSAGAVLSAAGGPTTLTGAGLDAVVIEAGLNARQAIAIIASAVAGVLAGAATTSVTVAAAGAPAVNRLSATVTADGNRTSVLLSPPA